jgi:hypothetical protein
VIVSAIEADPMRDDYRELAWAHGLRAAWSQPLLSKEGEALGTFVMYYVGISIGPVGETDVFSTTSA